MKIRSRITSVMMLIMVVFGLQVHAEGLQDLSEEDWFYEDVTYLAQEGVVSGYADGTFRPNEAVNVDAFIKLVVTSLGYELANGEAYWASTYIDKAIELKLIDEGNYGIYDRPITREEMASIAAKGLSLTQSISPYSHYAYEIEDYELIDGKYQTDVMIAMNEGIITGYEDYSFKPEYQATRAQAAVVVTRLINEEKRQFTDVFRAKINDMQEGKEAMESHAAWMHSYVDRVVDIFAGEDISVMGIEDTGKVINVLNAYLDDQLALLNTEIAFDYGDNLVETYTIDGVVWTYKSTLDHIQITGEPDDGTVITIDIVDAVTQILIKNVAAQLQCEFERHNEDKIYYIEFYDYAEQERVGYEISIEVGNKYQIIKEMDSDRTLKAYALYMDDKVIYGDQASQMLYKDVNDHHYEIEKTTAYGTELYVSIWDGEYYTDYTDNQMTGNGYRRSSDGIVYIGEFEEGDLNGKGSMFFTNGLIIEGEFDNFIPTCREGSFVGEDNDITALNKRMSSIIEAIITEDMPRYEKIRAIHDYVVLNVTYAEDTVEDNLSDMNYNNGYTAIMEGSSVCLGYAQAVNLLLNYIDIDAYIVLGDSDQDGINDHAWNYVYHAGTYYHVDATWDDQDQGDSISYDYFMKRDSHILKERDIYKILGWED